MYRINLDVINRIIYVEVSGFMSQEEINAYIADLRNLTEKFDCGQYSMLFLAQRLDPFSQENLPLIQKATELVLGWANRVATVVGNRTVTKMQLKRIELEARKNTNSNIPIMRFRMISEAMNYLNSI